MKIALEIDGDRFETENESWLLAFESILRFANLIDDTDSLEILSPEQQYVVDKSGY